VFPCGAPPVVAGRAIGAVAGTRYGTAAVRRGRPYLNDPSGTPKGKGPRGRGRGAVRRHHPGAVGPGYA